MNETIKYLIILRNGTELAKLLAPVTGRTKYRKGEDQHPVLACHEVDLSCTALVKAEAHLETPESQTTATVYLHAQDILLISAAPDSDPKNFGFLRE